MSRYAQQIKLEQIGLAGQLKLQKARILCIGAGGLGSSALLYLAAAGIGTLGIVDDDQLALSNLHRQVLYQTSQLNKNKAQLAAQQLAALNNDIEFNIYTERLTEKNAQPIISQYDIILDCTDNFATRYLINDICYALNKPYLFASVSQFIGQCSLFVGKQNPCLRCLYPAEMHNNTILDCATGGVLGVLPGLVGIIQATEALKWILRIGHSLANQLLIVDILQWQFRQFNLSQNPTCPLCFSKPVSSQEMSVAVLRQKIAQEGDIFLLDVRSLSEHQQFNIGGLLIPLPELSYRLAELPKDKLIVVYCRSGGRSMQAVNLLTAENFNCVNLQGGMLAWQA